MFTTGLTLALVTAGGFYLIYQKMPARIKRFMLKHALLTDVMACLLTYMLFGGTLVALFAAAFLGIIVSIMLALLNNPTTAAGIERFAKIISSLKNDFMQWAEKRSAPQTPTS